MGSASRGAANYAATLEYSPDLFLDFGARVDVGQTTLFSAGNPDTCGLPQRLDEVVHIGLATRIGVEEIDRFHVQVAASPSSDILPPAGYRTGMRSGSARYARLPPASSTNLS